MSKKSSKFDKFIDCVDEVEIGYIIEVIEKFSDSDMIELKEYLINY